MQRVGKLVADGRDDLGKVGRSVRQLSAGPTEYRRTHADEGGRAAAARPPRQMACLAGYGLV